MKKRIVLLCIILLSCVSCLVFKGKSTEVSGTVIACSESLQNEVGECINIYDKKTYIPAGEGFIVIDFVGEVALEKIEMKTTGSSIVSVNSTDYVGTKNYENIEINKRLKNEKKVSNLKLSFNSSEGFYFEKIKFYGENIVPKYMYDENEVIFDEFDERNPLNVYRIPIKKYIKYLAGDILGEKKENLSEHQKIVLFMDYICEYKIGYLPGITDDYLKDMIIRRIGSCGDYSNLLAALCAVEGIESRLITLANYPENSGHAVTEILINGKWSMYDPTYGVYYTTTPEDNILPEVLSVEELGEGKGKRAKRVVGNENHIISEMSYDFMGPEIYELAKPLGVVSPLNKLYYPIYFDYTKDKTINPCLQQGGSYLGIGNAAHAHLCYIIGLEEGKRYKIVIKSRGMGGEVFNPFITYAEVSGAELVENEKMMWQGEQDEQWEIELIANDSSIELILDYTEENEKFHYVLLKSFEIVEVK